MTLSFYLYMNFDFQYAFFKVRLQSILWRKECVAVAELPTNVLPGSNLFSLLLSM